MAKGVKDWWIKSGLFYAQKKGKKKWWKIIKLPFEINSVKNWLTNEWNLSLVLMRRREVTLSLFLKMGELGVSFKQTKVKSEMMGTAVIERIETKTGWHL